MQESVGRKQLTVRGDASTLMSRHQGRAVLKDKNKIGRNYFWGKFLSCCASHSAL
jgi:hypothetical protein